jgi:hypothetical protein
MTPTLTRFNTDNLILDETEFGNRRIKKILRHLDRIPERVLIHPIMKDVKVKITSRLLTDLEEMDEYRNSVPRGYENTGLTWDDRPGTYHQPTRQVLLSINSRTRNIFGGSKSSSKSVVLHEYGHAIEMEYLTAEMQDEFIGIHQEDFAERLLPRWARDPYNYYTRWSEYFAESLARHLAKCCFFCRISDRVKVFLKNNLE